MSYRLYDIPIIDEAPEALHRVPQQHGRADTAQQGPSRANRQNINTSARCRDGFLFIVADPAVEDRAGSIAYKSLYSTERTIPAGRVTQAVALLDTVAATNPNTHTNVLALQATLLWFDGRNGQAQQRAVRALQDDPWNRMAQLMLKATSAKVSPRWVH